MRALGLVLAFATLTSLLAPAVSRADANGNEPFFLGEAFEGNETVIFGYENEPNDEFELEQQKERIFKRSIREYRERLINAGVDLRFVTFLPSSVTSFSGNPNNQTYSTLGSDEPFGRSWKFSWKIQHRIIFCDNAIERAPGYRHQVRPFDFVTWYRIRISYGTQLIHDLDAYTSKRDIQHDLRFLTNETWHGEPSLSKLPLTGRFKNLREQRAQMARDNQTYIDDFKGPMKVYYHPDILKIEVELMNSDGLRVALVPIASGSRAQSYLFNGMFWWTNPKALAHHCRELTRPKTSAPAAQ